MENPVVAIWLDPNRSRCQFAAADLAVFFSDFIRRAAANPLAVPWVGLLVVPLTLGAILFNRDQWSAILSVCTDPPGSAVDAREVSETRSRYG